MSSLVERRVTAWLATTLALAVCCSLLATALLMTVGGERLAHALGGTAVGETLRLGRPQFSDSWGPMLRAYDAQRRRPERDLYAVFFTEHTKFQYPPASLLPFDALPRALTTPGQPPDEVPPALARALAWASRAAVVLTGVLTWLLLELCVRRARRRAPEPGPPAGHRADAPAAARRAAITRLVLVGALALTYYPLLKAYALGQAQVFLDVGVASALVLFALGREGAAGAALALCAFVKPQYAVVLLWALLRRHTRFAAACAAVLAVGAGLSVLRFGLQAHLSYLGVLHELTRHGEAYWPNQSVNGLLNRWLDTADPRAFDMQSFPPYNVAVYAATLVSSALFLGAAFVGRAAPRPRHRAGVQSTERSGAERAADDEALTDLLVVLAAATIASPIAWEHHYGTFLPIFAAVLPGLAADRPLGRATLPLAGASYLAMACVVQRPYWMLATRLRGLTASHLFAGAVGLFALLLTERARLRMTARAEAVGANREGDALSVA